MSIKHLTSFGIHQAVFKDLEDPQYWAVAKILGSAEPDLAQELIPLEGGSSMVPWAAAPGRASGELAITIREYNKELLKFLAPWSSANSETEDADGEAAGSITSLTNTKGTSVQSATTGIASVAVQTASSLVAGKYKVVAVSATTVDIYSDNDGQNSYVDSACKINSSPLTIATGDPTNFAGITLTGGSGTIGMTIGDIAEFEVNPISNYLLTYKLGASGACSREFSLTLVSECAGGKQRIVTYPRCICSANTTPQFLENEWSSIEATILILQPATVAYVAEAKFINR